jgi:hypothetical protein
MTATSPVVTEGRHAGGFIVSEANGYRSRGAAIISNGTSDDVYLNAGTVLARLEGAGTAAAVAGNTGNGTVGTITETGDAVPGVYRLTITEVEASNSAEFQVADPAGDIIGIGQTGVVFRGGGLSFTLSDGATDFVAGDAFDITVTDSGEYEVYTTSTSGAAGILFNEVRVPASGSAKITVVQRDAEVNDAELIWDTTINSAALKAKAKNALAALGIIAR